MLLLSNIMAQALPKLSSLDLTSTFANVANPWNPSHYAKLWRSDLTKLCITVVRTRRSIRRSSRLDRVLDCPIIPNLIRELSLTGPIVPTSRLGCLISTFEQLSSLSIVETNIGACEGVGVDIRAMLLSVHDPWSLRALNVIYDCSFGSP